MRKGELGEHSRKSRSAEGDADRPFKKARYVWQLKGKYHLKENSAKPNNTNYSESIDTTINNSDTDSETECKGNNNNNLRNNINKCADGCCIEDLLIHSNALLEKEDSDQEVSSIDKSISDEIPVTLVKPTVKNQDEYLYKWQARQVAKSFVDNTINSIIEHWKIAPFDAADFVENCDNGEQVEDEGILMAIQSHGLQPHLHYNSNSNQGEASRYESSGELPERPEETNEEENPAAMEDPMDFLNAAVSVAIQKKGLSSYNYG